MDEADPFDQLFSLEDQYYQDGYDQGFQDGVHQSHLEARLFGFEKGYEKFIEMGKVQARARLWSSNLRSLSPIHGDEGSELVLKDAAAQTRLKKHLDVLMALTDPATVVTRNTDDAVSAFDDRLKRANAKAKVIARMLEEQTAGSAPRENRAAAKTRLAAGIEHF